MQLFKVLKHHLIINLLLFFLLTKLNLLIMKNLKYFLSALVLGAMVLVSCDEKPVVVVPEPEEPESPTVEAVEGKVVLLVKFEGVICNDIACAGSYNGWDTGTALLFEEVDATNWPNWYKIVLDTVGAAVTYGDDNANSAVLVFKPAQLSNDGSFNWDYQTGDPASITVISGSVDVVAGYSGESNLYALSTDEPIVMIFSTWKNGNSPCVEKVKHDYTFTVTVPAATAADASIYIVGNFGEFGYPGWTADAADMKLTKQTNGTYTITLNQVAEGTEYKYVINGSWDNEELAAIVEGADCAAAISNRVTGTSAAIADTVENWKGVTATRCE